MLIALHDQTEDPIDEIKRIQPWQKDKLRKQLKFFTPEELKHLHSKLYEFDLGYKTGDLAMPLASSLDFFFVGI